MGLEINLLWKLIIFTIIIHFIDTLSYSVRLNSVKSGKFALSISLFNMIVLISRTANMMQGPLIGLLMDKSIKMNYDPIMDIRQVILATTIGTCMGILFIPTFLKLFSKAVLKLEETGSIPSLVVQSLSVANIKRITKSTIRPSKKMFIGLRFKNIPKRLLLLNTFITGVYTIGVLSAYYASIYVPENRLAVSASSGMINGIASILLTLFIDPKAALITDEAYRGKREYEDVKALVIMLIGTKLLGTLLAQLLFLPGAKFIAFFYK
ncbi:lipid II flippase Amj family protein [Anaerophilus nitritogenes]|uniref:lipid II flippase Amj family protein n=1 Tax=Anaerophilus nitritogenes TaxID=2498136 RepID=UPI00101C8B29|nr:lipid II flippase Amj family protein [Anaerophilus nitritogenes]